MFSVNLSNKIFRFSLAAAVLALLSFFPQINTLSGLPDGTQGIAAR